MNILVVEDDQSIREGIAAFLSEFGYTMLEAKDEMCIRDSNPAGQFLPDFSLCGEEYYSSLPRDSTREKLYEHSKNPL